MDLRSQVADFALAKAAKAVASRHKNSGNNSASATNLPESGATSHMLDPAETRQAPAIEDGKTIDALINPEATFFALFHTPAVTSAFFSRPKPSFLYDSLVRYPASAGRITRNENTGLMESPVLQPAYADGLVSELYESIPPVFHSYMAKSVEFPKLVSHFLLPDVFPAASSYLAHSFTVYASCTDSSFSPPCPPSSRSRVDFHLTSGPFREPEVRKEV